MRSTSRPVALDGGKPESVYFTSLTLPLAGQSVGLHLNSTEIYPLLWGHRHDNATEYASAFENASSGAHKS